MGELTIVAAVAGGSVTGADDTNRQRKVDEFLLAARTRFRTVVNAESILRQQMLDDLRFRASEQWAAADLAARQLDERPTLVINRLPQFIRQVTNAARASNMAVKITPVDDGADVDTAEVLQGLIRHIEQQSDAQVAYQTAGDHQATMGRGYWRVVTEYDDDDLTFNQVIKIKRIRNPFTVYVDPAAQEADGSDARFAFVVEDVPKDEYRRRYGRSAMAGLTEFSAVGDVESDWMPEGKVRIAEYWYVDTVEQTVVAIQWPDGTQQVVTGDELANLTLPDGTQPTVLQERVRLKRQVKVAIINAVEVLEGNDAKTEGRDWPGRWIPIVPAVGDEIDLDGRIDLRGMVRDAKDPQRLYNYQNSALAETLALVPRVPYVGAEGQFEGHEAKWRQANRRAFPYLEYRPVTLAGQAVPPPQRTSASADVGAIMTAIHQSDQDLKATMGLYEPSLGIRDSASQSGKAIQALQKQGEQANSNFLDNLSRAIRFTGRILVDLIPHVYDAPRVVRIIGTDERERKVMVHAGAPGAQLPDPDQAKQLRGIEGIYDVSVGRYDVAVGVGPSLQTKRDQAFQILSQFIQAYPNAFPILGDLLVASLDWPGAQAAAERLKKTLPPGLANDDDPNAAPPIPPQVQQQVQQMVQQMQAMGVELQQAKQLLASKQLELAAEAARQAAELASKERIAAMQQQTLLLQTEAKLQGADALARLKGDFDQLSQRLDHAHELGMAAHDRAHDRIEAAVAPVPPEPMPPAPAAPPASGTPPA